MNEPSQNFLLLQIHLHLHDGCNITCHHCSPRHLMGSNGSYPRFMPVELADQAVREAVPLGLQLVRVNGGDTFFFPDLDSIFDKIESYELGIVLETNGKGLTQQKLNRLVRLPQCSTVIALNGSDSATHDRYSSPGSFESATRAIWTLSQAGIPVQVVFTPHRRNIHQVDSIVRLVEEAGASSMVFNLVRPGAASEQPKKNGNGFLIAGAAERSTGDHSVFDDLWVEELIALGWRVERELTYTTNLRLIFEQPPAFRGLHPKARIENQMRCSILNSLSVTAAGEYSLCGSGMDTPGLALGSIGSRPLAEIWKSHLTLQLLREGLPNRLQGICERCMMKFSCMGCCPADNFLRTGSFWSPGWFCQSAEQVGLFPAGRLIENYW